MIAYYFRVMETDGTPTDYSGFVFGRDINDVFWTIDEFTDPYGVEIKSVTAKGTAGYCLKNNGDEGYLEIEISEKHQPSEEGGWKKPDWSKVSHASVANSNIKSE